MPSNSRQGRITSYKALPPPKRQVKFSARRAAVKPRVSLPKLQKEQSTLTQLDFISTPSMSREVISISSDDDEYEEERPKKKRRKSKFDEKERGQSTLTQIDRSALRERTRFFETDDDGFQIWDDFDPDQVVAEVAKRQDERRQKFPWLRQQDGSDVENIPEIPETSQLQAPASPRADSGVEMEHAVRKPALQTPPKRQVQEIPSSQTPPSTGYSGVAIVQDHEMQRSPLREKSANVQLPSTAHLSPESQNISMKMLEKVRQATRKVPLNDMPQRTSIHQSIMNESIAADDQQSNIDRPPRKLQRVTTIQDSQPEDLDLSNTTAVAESPIHRPSKLERVTTVQDSQYDHDDSLSDNDEMPEDLPVDMDTPEEQEYGAGDTQATFDPVHSALDRDAARFRWTQTQGAALPDIEEHHEDSETDDDDDLDRGCGQSSQLVDVEVLQTWSEGSEEAAIGQSQTGSQHPLEESSTRSPGAKAVSSDESSAEPDETTLRPDEVIPSSPPALPLSMTDKSSHDSAEAILPLSPPQLHPSQISAVVPAQASMQHLSSENNEIGQDSLQYTELSEASTIPPRSSSPQLPDHHSKQTILGSQMPLPPWSSPYQPPNPHGMNHPEFEMKDWSLPPPPPMSSSRVGTPAGSSK